MNKQIFQLKITLRDSKPPIWRRVQVFEDIRLAELHTVIQIVMGWFDCHLHEFHIDGEAYGLPDPELDLDRSGGDERKFRLNDLVSGMGAKFKYIYDFGDDWIHNVALERILPADPEVNYPVCLAGKRHCPPEDVGGVWGYAAFLEALADPEHERHRELLEWGGPFDPEQFSLDEINTQLSATFRPRKRASK